MSMELRSVSYFPASACPEAKRRKARSMPGLTDLRHATGSPSPARPTGACGAACRRSQAPNVPSRIPGTSY